ncbi:phosphate ABC transporter substrate-binding protein PstS family protein [Shimazuella sp. AN120528]|uniref:phosphate ABC transporter substrate-binding protein PstS family protein n=1 Tax=Shimazuella soli TaxID=1892854 RepID=UPI001F107959|nr:phosphate ABC transporter substrate-binding protein PstS family protein [Shimazuella soli]
MKKRILASGLIGLAFSTVLVACSSTADNQNNKQLSGNLTSVGSTAMQPFVEEASKTFMSNNPGVQINVQGGGSGQGLTAAMNDTADLGNSDIFAEEKQKIDASKLVDHKAFVVGIAPVVNPNVGVTNLTQQQLIDIFTGKIKNWKEVGGKDQAIVLVNRSESSGTRAAFAKFALKDNKEFRGKGGIVEDSSGTVRKIIGQTQGAIGYLAFSYVDNTVKALTLDGVQPTNENVTTNKWKVWAYEHIYTNANGKNKPLEEAFIKYILSDEVQKGLVTKLNYIPITNMKVERDASGNVK